MVVLDNLTSSIVSRAVDPPPILQLLVNDFDPESQDDVAEIGSSFWEVHCSLVTGQSSEADVSTISYFSEDGHGEVKQNDGSQSDRYIR